MGADMAAMKEAGHREVWLKGRLSSKTERAHVAETRRAFKLRKRQYPEAATLWFVSATAPG